MVRAASTLLRATGQSDWVIRGNKSLFVDSTTQSSKRMPCHCYYVLQCRPAAMTTFPPILSPSTTGGRICQVGSW